MFDLQMILNHNILTKFKNWHFPSLSFPVFNFSHSVTEGVNEEQNDTAES
jgi:hypothetical protein